MVPKKDNEGNIRRAVDISMNGINTFNHAVFSIPKQIKTLMNYLGISGDDIDYLIHHQANKFMLDFIVKKLKFDKTKLGFWNFEFWKHPILFKCPQSTAK